MKPSFIKFAASQVLFALCLAAGAATYQVDLDRPGGVYRCGETAVFKVTLLSTNDLAAAKSPCATLDNFGKSALTNMPFGVATTGIAFTVSGTLREPGFLRLSLPPTKNGRNDPFVFSAGFEPEKIGKGSPSPNDFDAFWAEARMRLAREVPLDPQVVHVPERSTDDFDFYRVSFATFGRRVHGYMSVPTDKSKAPFPVDFGVNAAGFGGWTNDMKGEKDSIRVQFSVYPFPPDWKWKASGLEAAYKAMDEEAHAKFGSPSYCHAGITASREDYFFYPVILGIDRAVDWLAARPDVDRSRFRYEGTSQGGGFGFYLCGLNRAFTRAAFYVPAITDTMGYLKGRDSGWPKIVENNSSTPERRAAAEKWAPYFDGANFASRITCPVRVAVGFSDTTCPPCAVYAAYNEIKVKDKAIGNGIGMTHSCSSRFYSEFGRWVKSSDEGNGFCRVRQGGDGRWWIVGPDGRDLFLRGIDHANWNGHFCEALGVNPYREEMKKRFASRAEWETQTLDRLNAWGFNALGAGCSPELRRRGLFHTEFLGVGQNFCAKGGEHAISKFEGIPGTAFPNVFHPDFAAFCDDCAARLCIAQKDDSSILGYFFDNELAWDAKGASATGMFDAVAKMPPTHPARTALDAFLASRGVAADAIVPEDVKTEFLRLAARRYFETVAAAIRRHDPNHLLLGARFAGLSSAHRVVWEEAGKICDILTFNNYPWADLDENVVYFSRKDGVRAADAYALRHSWAKKPMMITEWSFPALDSGLPCSNGAGQRFRTQAERTQATELFARTLLALPFMVGYDYFMWVDEPALGISRKFPEDSNYGLVNERGEPYAEITQMFSRLNREAEKLHARGEMPAARPVDAEARRRAALFPADAARSTGAAFSRDGDAYTLATASGLVMKGCIGGRNVFDSVVVDGVDCGRFTLMLFNGDYRDIDRVESAEWMPERETLRISGTGASGRKSFRIVCDIVPFAAKPWFAANVVRVENTCAEEFSDIKVFFRQYAPWSADWAKGGFKAPQNVWKAPSSAVWIRSSDGAWCGGVTYAPTVRHFVYWMSGDGTPHPDAMFSPVGSTRLAAGTNWEPQGQVWMVAAAGTGGKEGWRRFVDEFIAQNP